MASDLADYVAQQTAFEWQRKGSLETRCFSLLTADLAFVTLYLALSNQAQLGEDLRKSGPRTFLLISLIAAVASIAVALWAARPMPYQAIAGSDLDETRRLLVDSNEGHETERPAGDGRKTSGNATGATQNVAPTAASLADELLEAQIRDLNKSRELNACRAKLFFVSLIALGVEVATLIISLAIAASH